VNQQEKLLSESKRKDQESTQRKKHLDISIAKTILNETKDREDNLASTAWYQCDWDSWHPDNS
jgi:hypothetical protein